MDTISTGNRTSITTASTSSTHIGSGELSKKAGWAGSVALVITVKVGLKAIADAA
jgi:hypothetical protein